MTLCLPLLCLWTVYWICSLQCFVSSSFDPFTTFRDFVFACRLLIKCFWILTCLSQASPYTILCHRWIQDILKDISVQLLELHQGTDSAAYYAVKFFLSCSEWLEWPCTDRPRSNVPHRLENLSPWAEGPEPMQLGWTCVSEQERQSLCFYCGMPGHQLYMCPKKPSTSKVEGSCFISSLSLPALIHYTHVFFFCLSVSRLELQ